MSIDNFREWRPKQDEVIVPMAFENDPSCQFFQSSPADSFGVEELYDSGDASAPPAYHVCSDISAILNQIRLGKELGPIADEVFKNIRTSDVSDQFSGLSDEDIISCIKSRYIQRPSELKDWTQYLMAELTHLAESKKQEVQETVESSATEIQSETNSE